MSYRASITYQKGTNFQQKTPTLATYDEGVLYAESLADRSSMIADYRVDCVEASPTHTFVGGKLKCLAVGS